MPPRILRTESKSDLDKLQADIEREIYPTDSIERGFVDDIVHHTWDIMRYRRVADGILDNALRRGLAQVLDELLLPPSATMSRKRLMASQRLSHGWLIDPETDRRIASVLEEAGRDESAIEAKAFTLVAEDLENANRMLKSARDGRDKAYKSIDKYRKSSAVQLRRNSDRALAADRAPFMTDGEEN